MPYSARINRVTKRTASFWSRVMRGMEMRRQRGLAKKRGYGA